MELLIGIPTFNRSEGLDYLLRSIQTRTQDVDYKIIVCQDSANTTQQDLTKFVINKYSNLMNITYIQNDKNVGVAASWNNIIKSDIDNCPYIILLNDDIIVEKDSIKNMLYFIANNPNIGAVAYELNGIKDEDIPKLIALIAGSEEKLKPYRTLVAWGAYWGFNREKYNIVGGFDEFYRMSYEEADFCTALVSKGYINYLIKCPKSWHIGGATRSKIGWPDQANIKHYIEKWKGTLGEMSKLINKIPLQKVRWTCENQYYETLAMSLKRLNVLIGMR